MFSKLKAIFKTKDEKALDIATEDFDELMGKVDEDQQDLTKLENHMRAEWDEIHEDVKEVKQEVDAVVKDTA